MVHWIDNVAFGVDFRKRKDEPVNLTELANELILSVTNPMDPAFFNARLHDTLPCEYLAPMDDPA